MSGKEKCFNQFCNRLESSTINEINEENTLKSSSAVRHRILNLEFGMALDAYVDI